MHLTNKVSEACGRSADCDITYSMFRHRGSHMDTMELINYPDETIKEVLVQYGGTLKRLIVASHLLTALQILHMPPVLGGTLTGPH